MMCYMKDRWVGLFLKLGDYSDKNSRFVFGKRNIVDYIVNIRDINGGGWGGFERFKGVKENV